MPFGKIASRRQKTKSMHFFKGTAKEMEEVPAKKAMAIFAKNGVCFSDAQQARKIMESLRKKILSVTGHMSRFGIASHTFCFETPSGAVVFEVDRKKGTFMVHQLPATHGVRGFPSPFEKLKEILANGFRGKNEPNVIMYGYRTKTSTWGDVQGPDLGRNKEETLWDQYSIEIMAPLKFFGLDVAGEGFVEKASPQQILKVNIKISGSAEEKKVKRKKEFYIREIQKKFGIPVNFVIEKANLNSF